MKKAFLCVNITENEDNEIIDGSDLVTGRISAEQERSLQKVMEDATDILMKKAKLPLWLRITSWISGAVAFLIVVGILKSDTDLKTAYYNAAPLFYIAGVTAVIWATISLFGFFKNKKVMDSDETKNVIKRAEDYASSLYSYLGVPADAKKVDVFMMWYKKKNGERKIKKIVDETHQNHEYRMFIADEDLCVADACTKYSIPLHGLTSLTRVDKKAVVSDWNKDEPYNDKKYKPYKITTDKYETNYFFRYYISLSFSANGDEYEMFLPPYEADVITSLTGLSIDA